MTTLFHLSDALFLRINDFARTSTALHTPAIAFAKYGIAVFAALILVGVWPRRGASNPHLAAALWDGAGALLAVAVHQPVAALVAEARPYVAHPAALTLVDRTTDWSFPSDHSVMAGAAAVGLLLVVKRLGIVAALAAMLMAVTRVYVGAHYPHDVVAGLLLGAAVSALGWLLVRLPMTRLVGAVRRLPVVDRVLAPVA